MALSLVAVISCGKTPTPAEEEENKDEEPVPQEVVEYKDVAVVEPSVFGTDQTPPLENVYQQLVTVTAENGDLYRFFFYTEGDKLLSGNYALDSAKGDKGFALAGQLINFLGFIPIPYGSLYIPEGSAEDYAGVYMKEGTFTVKVEDDKLDIYGKDIKMLESVSNASYKKDISIHAVFSVKEEAPSAANDYWNKVETQGALEAKYMKLGSSQVKTYEEAAEGTLGKFEVWYPSGMETSGEKYPVIISNNGTGCLASTYPKWFEHMASWGFIVVGNEEGTSWDGVSAEKSLAWILDQNANKASIFYHHLDTDNIGTIGHSQGGTGVVNCITVQPHADMYKTSVMLASTHNGYNPLLQWTSDASRIKVPTLILVADADGLTSMEDYNKLYNAIPDTVSKLAARRLDCVHGDMLFIADGYVTAWMMWQLKGDGDGRAVVEELESNSLYKNVRTNLL